MLRIAGVWIYLMVLEKLTLLIHLVLVMAAILDSWPDPILQFRPWIQVMPHVKIIGPTVLEKKLFKIGYF